MTGTQLRMLRLNAGLNGTMVCRKAGISRTRLSDIERGYAEAQRHEAERIESAIRELKVVREEASRMLVEVGWPGRI